MCRRGRSSSCRAGSALRRTPGLLVRSGLILGLCAALSVVGCSSPERLTTAHIELGGIELTVEVADTVRERARGMQGRPEPLDDSGMLFVWDEPGPRAFAIEEVPYDLDVIFIGADGLVSEVGHLSPDGPYRSESATMALWVLEVRGGWARDHEVGPGSFFAVLDE